MLVSKKSIYAIRAILQLMACQNQMPVKSAKIASLQKLSSRFMEIVLNDLKHGGFVESRRGADGGYLLTLNPKETKVLDVISHVDGSIAIINNAENDEKKDFLGKTALNDLWEKLAVKINSLLSEKTMQDLYEEELSRKKAGALNYVI